MKKTFLFVALAIFSLVGKVHADEGMWLPMFVERLNYVDMEKWVFNLLLKNSTALTIVA